MNDKLDCSYTAKIPLIAHGLSVKLACVATVLHFAGSLSQTVAICGKGQSVVTVTLYRLQRH